MSQIQLQTELQAIREGVAIAPIADRAFLRITGPDASRWLNGMVTNNIKDLTPGEGNYNFLLNAQGRIQGDCTIYREPAEKEASFLLETDKSQVETIHRLLDKFIIMDDVELAPESTETFGWMLLGPEAPKLLNTLDLPTLEPLHMARSTTKHGTALLIASSPGPVPSYELYAEKYIVVRDAIELSPEALEANRILSGIPKYGRDIRDRDLPQETAQTHALHFAKGCYLGQEIVERIRSRGQVHRIFTQFRLAGSLLELPAALEANGRPAGELTSAIQLGDDIIALGYARREALGGNQTLTYSGGTATVLVPNP